MAFLLGYDSSNNTSEEALDGRVKPQSSEGERQGKLRFAMQLYAEAQALLKKIQWLQSAETDYSIKALSKIDVEIENLLSRWSFFPSGVELEEECKRRITLYTIL